MQKIITLIVFFALQFTFAQNASEYNSGAINAFNAGNYAQAKDYFELSLAQADNAKTNYNLANTCEKLGEIGAAKAYYMRAIYKEPRFKEAIYNLEALDKKYSLSSYNTSRSDAFFDELSMNEWIILCSISFWIALILLIALPLLKIRKAWQIFLGVVFLSLSTLSAFGIKYWHSYANTAIAIVDNAPLRLSPTKTSNASHHLKQGQMLSTSSEKNDFLLASNPTQKGWISIDGKNFMLVKSKKN